MYFLLIICFFAFALFFTSKQSLLVIVPLLVIFRFIKNKTLLLILSLIASCLFGLLTKMGTINRPGPLEIFKEISSATDFQLVNYTVISLIFAILLAHFILNKIKHLSLGHFTGISVFIGISLIWIYALNYFSLQKSVYGIFLITTVIFFKMFGIWILILSYKGFSHKNWRDYLHTIQPFWDTSVGVRPEVLIPISARGHSDLDREAMKIFFVLATFFSINSLLKILFSTTAVSEYLPVFPLLELNMTSVFQQGISISRWQFLLLIFVNGAYYLFGYLSWVCAIDVCYRLLGFEPTRQFYFPFKAKSASEFYSLVMPYYSHSLNITFLFPLYMKIRKTINRRDFSYSLALFLSVFFYGYIFHVALDIAYFVKYNFLEVLWRQFISLFPYSIVVFLMLRFLKIPQNPKYKIITVPLFFVFIFFAFGLLMIFRLDPMDINISDKLHILIHFIF